MSVYPFLWTVVISLAVIVPLMGVVPPEDGTLWESVSTVLLGCIWLVAALTCASWLVSYLL